MIDLNEEMRRLALARPVFHSEADFQHALAWSLKEGHPDLHLRLEAPRPGRPGAIDLIARRAGATVLALELKYICVASHYAIEGEAFNLKSHGGNPQRRYDVARDLELLEDYATAHPNVQTGAIVLTNDQGYWNPRRPGTTDAAFCFSEDRSLTGILGWSATASAGLKQGRTAPINLAKTYRSQWQDYFEAPPRPQFRFVWLRA